MYCTPKSLQGVCRGPLRAERCFCPLPRTGDFDENGGSSDFHSTLFFGLPLPHMASAANLQVLRSRAKASIVQPQLPSVTNMQSSNALSMLPWHLKVASAASSHPKSQMHHRNKVLCPEIDQNDENGGCHSGMFTVCQKHRLDNPESFSAKKFPEKIPNHRVLQLGGRFGYFFLFLLGGGERGVRGARRGGGTIFY